MKNLFYLLFGLSGTIAASAQSEPQHATAGTQKTEMDKISAVSPGATSTNAASRAAGSGESLTVPQAKANSTEASENKRIPDGSYGTNRSGQVYSPSNPNFPYDRNGKIYPAAKPEVFYNPKNANSAVTNRAGTDQKAQSASGKK